MCSRTVAQYFWDRISWMKEKKSQDKDEPDEMVSNQANATTTAKSDTNYAEGCDTDVVKTVTKDSNADTSFNKHIYKTVGVGNELEISLPEMNWLQYVLSS